MGVLTTGLLVIDFVLALYITENSDLFAVYIVGDFFVSGHASLAFLLDFLNTNLARRSSLLSAARLRLNSFNLLAFFQLMGPLSVSSRLFEFEGLCNNLSIQP